MAAKVPHSLKRLSRRQVPAAVLRPPVGRPSKLTPEIERMIVETILGGNTRGCAAARAGICYKTFENWMNRGESIEGQPNPSEEDVDYFNFFQIVNQAEAEAHARTVQNIVGQGKKNFQAGAWWLERRWQKDWNKPEKKEITNPDGSLAPKVLIYIPDNGRDTTEKAVRGRSHTTSKKSRPKRRK